MDTERACSVDGCHYHDVDTLFYVTVVDGKRYGFLLGPYPTHQEAIDNVARGRNLANDADPRAAFYAFGTASTKDNRRTVFGTGGSA